MSRRTETITLAPAAAGTGRCLNLHRYGNPDARPKAYIQAALHADETPPLLVAHHLMRLLDEVEVTGQVLLVPYANPIGLAQMLNGDQLGRYEFNGGGNFNRNWPDLAAAVAPGLEARLSADADANVATIRAAMAAWLEAWDQASELGSLRRALARLACDADLVLDLHCDDQALMHLFLIPQHWPAATDLAAELGCRAVLLAEDSGGAAFDETFSTCWTRLAARFPEHPIPPVCLSGTVELRGRSDVEDATARADAEAILRCLQRRAIIAGEAPAPPELRCEATRFDAAEIVKAPAPGVLAYAVELGASVRAGDLVAEIVDPASESGSAARQALYASTDGLILTRRSRRYVVPGETVAKIVGREPLPHRQGGALLED